mgnify:CR=1 FL=1
MLGIISQVGSTSRLTKLLANLRKHDKIRSRRNYGTEKASLACTECGSRNYSIGVSSNPKPVRLEVNKYCKHCKKYTLHKETR